MNLSRLQKRLTALTTALLLTLCQLAFAAQACAHGVAAKEAATSMPCHDMDSTPATPKPASVCDVPTPVGADISLPILSIADLPGLATGPLATGPIETASPYRYAIQAAYHPPPLTVLHCRFLN